MVRDDENNFVDGEILGSRIYLYGLNGVAGQE